MKFFINDKKEITLEPLPKDKQKLFTKKLNYASGYLYSVIARHSMRRKNGERPIGDNCPMIYAMKGLEGLSVTDQTIEQLYHYADKIIRAHPFSDTFDFIIVVPSKHSIAQNLGNILAKAFDIPLSSNFLKKNSADNARKDIKSNPSLSSSDKQSILNSLKKCSSEVSLKEVKNNLRRHIPLFEANNIYIPEGTKHIVLVDDISSSGATFEQAIKIVQKHCPNIEKFSAFTLFSPLK